MHAIDAADRVQIVFNPDYSCNLEIPPDIRHHLTLDKNVYTMMNA